MAKLEIGEMATKSYSQEEIISIATTLLGSAKGRLAEAVRQQNLGYVGQAEATIDIVYKMLVAQERKNNAIQNQPLTI